jgi:cytochrome c553
MKRPILITIGLLAVALAARADNAEANWRIHCAMCHGKKGQANTPAGRMLGAPNLRETKVQAGFTDEQAFKAIKEGIQQDGRMKMKAYANELTDKDIRELVSYLRTFKKGKR